MSGPVTQCQATRLGTGSNIYALAGTTSGGVTSINTLSGAVLLAGGANVTVSNNVPSAGLITVACGGVTTLTAGSNIVITGTPSNLTVASSAASAIGPNTTKAGTSVAAAYGSSTFSSPGLNCVFPVQAKYLVSAEITIPVNVITETVATTAYVYLAPNFFNPPFATTYLVYTQEMGVFANSGFPSMLLSVPQFYLDLTTAPDFNTLTLYVVLTNSTVTSPAGTPMTMTVNYSPVT